VAQEHHKLRRKGERWARKAGGVRALEAQESEVMYQTPRVFCIMAKPLISQGLMDQNTIAYISAIGSVTGHDAG
jgi:hypothetical protein